MFHDAGLKSPKFEIAGTGVKVTVWAQKVADKAADKVADKISPSEERILSVVTQYPGNNINGIMSITGFSNSYIRKILTALIQMGKVEHRGSKKTGGYYAIDQ